MTQGVGVLVLSESDVWKSISLQDCLPLQAQALRAQSLGTALTPRRIGLSQNSGEDTFAFMSGWLPTQGLVGIKAVSVFRSNRHRGLPTTQAVVQLFEPETGELRALVAAGALTRMRTAATALLAVQVLSPTYVPSVGLFGAGGIAGLILHGLSEVLETEVVKVYVPSASGRSAVARLGDRELPFRVVAATEPRDAAQNDLVLAATSSRIPVFQHEWLLPTSSVVSMASGPHVQEVPSRVFHGRKIVVDSRPLAVAEVGELAEEPGLTNGTTPIAELGDLLTDSRTRPTSATPPYIFKPVGLAIQDLLCADLAVVRAASLGIGHKVDFTGPGEY